jgi:DNA-binding NtrC family response regulator
MVLIITGTRKGFDNFFRNVTEAEKMLLKQTYSCHSLLISNRNDSSDADTDKIFADNGLSLERIDLHDKSSISEQTLKLIQHFEQVLGRGRRISYNICNIWIITNDFPASLYEELSKHLDESEIFHLQPFNPYYKIDFPPQELWQHKNPETLLDEVVMPYRGDFLDIEERMQVRAALINPGSVLITGAIGMGKTMLAKFIHEHFGPTANYPFVSLNLAGIGEDIAMAELKGTVKGAFTGAITRQGLLEKAAGGTLLLDEIAEADKRVQVKLLDLVQPRRAPVMFEKIGSTETEKSLLRFIAATNMPEVKWADYFRSDLRSRLPIRIHLKNLYEKKDDVGNNSSYFKKALQYFTDGYFLGNPIMTPLWDHKAVEKAVKEARMPDNLRELKSFVELLLDKLIIEKRIGTRKDRFRIDDNLIRDASENRTKQSIHDEQKVLPRRDLLRFLDTLEITEEEKFHLIGSTEEELQDLIHNIYRTAFNIALIAANGNQAKARRISGIRNPELFKCILNDPSRLYFHPRLKKRSKKTLR